MTKMMPYLRLFKFLRLLNVDAPLLSSSNYIITDVKEASTNMVEYNATTKY